MIRQGPSYGIGLRALSALCFSLMTACMKWASTVEPVSAGEMVFFRSLFGLPVVLIWIMSRGEGLIPAISTQRPLVHLWRCALGCTGILLIFEGLRHLSLADATTIGFTSPIFATLLSILVLSEKVGKHRWVAIALGFIGVVVVLRPGMAGAPPLIGLLWALSGAFLAASVTVTLRKLGKTESATSIVFWFFVACCVVGGTVSLFTGQNHSWQAYAILAAGGVAGGLAQMFMTSSLRHASVATLAPLDYLQLLGAVILGWFLFSDGLTTGTMVGAGLIVFSGLYTAWREQVRRREVTPPSPNTVV